MLSDENYHNTVKKKLIDNDMDLLGAIRGDFGPFLGVFGGFFLRYFFSAIGLAQKTPSRLHVPSGEVLESFLGTRHFFFFWTLNEGFPHVIPVTV